MSRDDPETLLQMLRATESENRQLGALVESLRVELKAARSCTITPADAEFCEQVVIKVCGEPTEHRHISGVDGFILTLLQRLRHITGQRMAPTP